MAAQPSLIPVEEYLRMTSEPDCKYVAGAIEERPAGEYDHATWQRILATFLPSGKRILASKHARNCA